MSVPAQIIAVYFIIGLLVLILFELITKRISTKLTSAGVQAQITMAEAGNPIGRKVGVILMAVLTWVAWPMVLVGAATKVNEEEKAKRDAEVQSLTTAKGSGGRVAYLLKKLWYGECPDCHVLLKPMGGLLSRSVCPSCKVEYSGIIVKAIKKEGYDGERETLETGEGRGRAGGAMGPATSQEAGEQPDNSCNTKAS
jgi:hypothetical protein